jgi:hypothetical protein
VGQWNYYPATTLPAPYDIVWCRFPDNLNLDAPGIKDRPALVLQTAHSSPGFRPEVRVIYGTSNLKTATRPFDFFVKNLWEMDEAGLAQATRFDLDRVLWMPWASEFFMSPGPRYPSPVMGSLSENSRRLLGFVIEERRRRASPDN